MTNLTTSFAVCQTDHVPREPATPLHMKDTLLRSKKSKQLPCKHLAMRWAVDEVAVTVTLSLQLLLGRVGLI
jgi:hypothetical protein